MSNKEYWVEQYKQAKRERNDIVRRRAYKKLIEILGSQLKEKDIK